MGGKTSEESHSVSKCSRLTGWDTGNRFEERKALVLGHLAEIAKGIASTMRVFFDTEFTGLSSDPRLLSIGMVAENGSKFYVELTDGWSEENCSAWVREHVIPLLGKGDKCTRREAGKRIFSWLSFAEDPPTLLSDSDWDTTLLAELMDECGIPRERYHLEILEYKTKIHAKAFEEARLRHFQSLNLMQHHALHDAQVFHAAWVSVFGADASHAD